MSELIGDKSYDFILCMGDDVTDEFMFNDLPELALNVKVGKKTTQAGYYIENTEAVKALLNSLVS